MHLTRASLTRGLGLGLLACALAQPVLAVHIEEVAAGVSAPWGIAFSPFHTRYFAGGNKFASDDGASAIVGADLREVAVCADGTVWMTEPTANKVWRYLSYDGTMTAFAVPGAPTGVACGPVGFTYFTLYSGNEILYLGRDMVPGDLYGHIPIPTANSHPTGITYAIDGTVWFVEESGNKVGVVMDGNVVEYPLPTAGASPSGIAASSGHTLAITEPGVDKIAFFDISLHALVGEPSIPTGLSGARGIAFGQDGAFWFVEYAAAKIGRAKPGEPITELYVPTGGSHPRSIAAGPNGDLWFTEQSTGKLGRIELHPSGDVNADGNIDVSDVFYLINYLFAGGPVPK
jgi:virginiamycin B lyase